MARPEKEINWEIVEKRMEAGCSGLEIAQALRINDDTFYNRFKKHYGKSFQDYSGRFKDVGIANVKFTQYIKAISGNNAMLLLLGREWLKQGKLDEYEKPPYEEMLSVRHENMMLRAELQRLKEEHANESQAK